jgi:hypothetical protein
LRGVVDVKGAGPRVGLYQQTFFEDAVLSTFACSTEKYSRHV